MKKIPSLRQDARYYRIFELRSAVVALTRLKCFLPQPFIRSFHWRLFWRSVKTAALALEAVRAEGVGGHWNEVQVGLNT